MLLQVRYSEDDKEQYSDCQRLTVDGNSSNPIKYSRNQ